MLDYQPKMATEHRRNWPAIVSRIWDFSGLGPGDIPEGRDRPGLHREHVLDFHDGLRLVVSNDRYQFGTYLHVSASLRPGSRLYEKANKRKRDLAKWFVELVQDRVRFVGGAEVEFAYQSFGKGIPHFFDPPLEVQP